MNAAASNDPDRPATQALFSDCRIAAQPIRALNPGSEPLRPWVEFLLRPAGLAAHLTPPEFVRQTYDGALGLGLDRLMVSLACGWAARNKGLRVSVNIHPDSLADEFFVRFVLAKVAGEDIEPDQLCLELLERAHVSPVRDLAPGASRLHGAGIMLGLDDFGRGHASMDLATWLPVSFIKIDRAFVSGPGDIAFRRRTLRGLLAFAAATEIFTVAEGIESADQLRDLTMLEVAYGQGRALGDVEILAL